MGRKFRFFTTVLTVGLLLFSTLYPGIGLANAESNTVASNKERAYIPDELIVQFKEKKSSFSNSQYNRLITASFPELGLALIKVSETELEKNKTSLAKDSNVESVEYNYIYKPLSLSEDPFSNWQWGLHNTGQTIEGSEGLIVEDMDINLPEAWKLIENKEEKLAYVIVAVLDDGVQTNHPDIKNSIWVNTDEIPNNGKDDDGNGYIDDVNGWDFYHSDPSVVENDEDGTHGTHLSGTIAATADNGIGIAGIAANAKLMPLKFIHGNEGGNVWDAIAGIRYAEINGARILLAGWGSTYRSKALEKAIKASKMLFVTAAGNAGIDNDGDGKNYPSSIDSDNIISVGAADKNGEITYFSNYGTKSVHLVAPGISVYSTAPGNSYSFAQGTSMAAAHVAGVAALLAGIQHTFSPKDIKQVLRLTGTEVNGAKETIFRNMVDAEGALAYYLVSLPLIINPIYDSSRFVAGSTEPDAVVRVENKDRELIVEGIADKDGKFNIRLDKHLPANTELIIFSKKGLINSKDILITVAHDEEKPVLVGNSLDITDKSTKIEGKVSEFAKVDIKIASEEYFAVTNDDGSFSIDMGKSYPKDTKGEYTLTDLADPANITRENFEVKDSVAPHLVVVPSVNDKTTVVQGQVSKKATVQLKAGNKVLHPRPIQTDESGKFEITISKQKMGTKITIVMVDDRGQESQELIEVGDGTGPIISKLKTVYDTSRFVEGFVNEASKITIQKSSDGREWELLTEEEFSAAANEVFSFKLPSKLAKDYKIKIVAEDLFGNIGQETILVVKEDRTAPKLVEPKKIYIDDIGENEAGETIVKGKLNEEGTVDVIVGLASILDEKVFTDEDGSFTVTIPKRQAKEKLIFVFEDTKTGKPNTSKLTVTVTDRTGPKFTSDIELFDSSRTITGVLNEAGKVMAMVEQSGKMVKVTSQTARWNKEKQGYVFTITMKERQKVGTKVQLQAVDNNDNTSEVLEVTVKEDQTKPELSKLDGELIITDAQTSVKGKVTKEATVQLFAGNQPLHKAAVKTDAAGNFRITIKKQKAGTEITVKMQDYAIPANITEEKVTVIDKTNPVVSKVDTVYQTAKSITGKVSEQSTVTAYRGNTAIGSAKTDANGMFSIPVTGLFGGEKLIIVAVDQAALASKSKSITVRKDTAAPRLVLEETIQVSSTEITGRLNEAGKVSVTSTGYTTINNIQASEDSLFTIPLTGWQLKKGQSITITVEDLVGNKKNYRFKVK